jgi:hypothetical protein
MFKEKNVKGQTVLADLLVAVMLFLLLLALFNNFWVFNSQNYWNQIFFDDMQEKAIILINELITSKGIPENWEDLPISDVNAIGLAEKDRVISEEKITAFNNFNSYYTQLKEILKTNPYDFFFEFDGSDDFNVGLQPMTQAMQVRVKRIVQYKGGEAIVKLTLYKVE